MLHRADSGTKPGPQKRLLDFSTQIALIGGAALLYFAVRGRTEGSESAAVSHGLNLLDLEGFLGIDIETRLQSAILPYQPVVTLMNWVYIWGHWPLITLTLVWLYRTRRQDYLLLRNALFVSGAIGLVIFVTYPVAPPRLLPGGFVDTVTEYSTSYRVLQPPSLVNKYAALPSLHVGWNLLAGIAIFRSRANRFTAVFGVVSPMAMVAAVVLTGNHYVLDAALGAVVALAGLAVAWWLASRDEIAPAAKRSPLPLRPVFNLAADRRTKPQPVLVPVASRRVGPCSDAGVQTFAQNDRPLVGVVAEDQGCP